LNKNTSILKNVGGGPFVTGKPTFPSVLNDCFSSNNSFSAVESTTRRIGWKTYQIHATYLEIQHSSGLK